MNTTGTIDILNCGYGHMQVTFNEKDVLETERAKRIIADMLRRGYALFVHGTDDTLIRVEEFDAKKNCYIIADGPTIPPEAVPLEEVKGAVSVNCAPKKRGRPRKAVPAVKVKVTAVGRSAGG